MNDAVNLKWSKLVQCEEVFGSEAKRLARESNVNPADENLHARSMDMTLKHSAARNELTHFSKTHQVFARY